MWGFIRQVFAVFFALILFVVVGFFILIGIGASMTSKSVVTVSSNSVLHLKLNKPILEREEDNPLEELGLPIRGKSGMGLIELKEVIKSAKKDDNIKGIYLEAESIQAGYASVEEIRNALSDFKTSGKFIYAYAEVYSEGGYYLSSLGDKIFLNPVGLLELNGYSSRNLYLKGTLEKLEIKPEVFKVGNYKSAIEPLTRDNMSDYNREQTLSFINSMNTHMLSNISKSRNIPMKFMKLISDSMLVHNGADALKYNIVTNLGYYDEVLASIKKVLNLSPKNSINFISYNKYKKSIEDKNDSHNKIAVIIAQGDINRGKADEESIGSDDMAEEIRKARNDSSIKAVVLRINSPGGDALASDIMWREVVLTSKVKPIIASMSDVAASGGYYIAMGCDKIVAQPNSITGSIGVFGILFNIQDFLKNKLGVTADGVKTGLFSDIGNPTRQITPFERKSIQKEVDDIYVDFVKKASEGRKMTYSKLEALASGRVWSGLEAKENGLVDVIGGLDDAVKLAANMVHVDEDYKVIYLPKGKSYFEKILDDLQQDVTMKTIKHELGSYFYIYDKVKHIKKMEGIQARLPFEPVLN